MPLPVQTLNIDVLDPEKTGLYNGFSSTDKITAPMVVRENGWYIAIQAMQADLGGVSPWDSVDISTAQIKVSIDNPDLFPLQGEFFATFGANNTANLINTIGSTNLEIALNGLASMTSAGGCVVVQEGTDLIITFNSNGAQTLLSATAVSLYPASSVYIYEDQAGTSALPSIQVMRLQQLPATLQSTFTTSGTTMAGELNLATPGMLARFNALPPNTPSFAAFLEVTVQFPGQDPQTILLIPVTVLRNVIRNGVIAVPPLPPDNYVQVDPTTNALISPDAVDFYAANPPPASSSIPITDVTGLGTGVQAALQVNANANGGVPILTTGNILPISTSNIVQGTNITITPGGGVLTISASGGASDSPTLTATGSITLARLGIVSHHNLAPVSGSSGNTSIAELSATNALDGDTTFVYCAIPAVSGQIFELKDNTGSVVAIVSSSGASFVSTIIAFYSGSLTKWVCNFQSA